jgi:hypothetical protein
MPADLKLALVAFVLSVIALTIALVNAGIIIAGW